MRTITNVVASAAWAVLALVQMSDAFAVTRTWTGTTSGAWSVGSNWGGTAPQPGDDLAFPAGASNKSTNNDFAAGISFNSITVDSDTSTSDTLLLFATGKGGTHPAITRATDKRLASFKEKLDAVLLDLALQVVKDGEGAS